jgi:hypothetical protein
MIPFSSTYTLKGDYTDDELRQVMASFASADSGQVCSVACVITTHRPDGGHDLRIVSDREDRPRDQAGLLAHAALHLLGSCGQCGQRPKGERRGFRR